MEYKETRLQSSEFRPWDMEEKQFTVLMHISQFAGYIFPFAGYALPIVMWVLFKDKSEVINEHGKKIINWMISSIIYGVFFGILCFLLIGFPLLWALGICLIVFPILGAVKANEGIVWKYPGTINFLG